MVSEYGLGNEVSTHGDVYSYGILLLEMFSGKRPTDSEFGEAIGLRKYVQMALPDRVRIIIDQQLLPEIRGGEEGTLNSDSIRDMRIACVTSILQVGISCSEEFAGVSNPHRDGCGSRLGPGSRPCSVALKRWLGWAAGWAHSSCWEPPCRLEKIVPIVWTARGLPEAASCTFVAPKLLLN